MADKNIKNNRVQMGGKPPSSHSGFAPSSFGSKRSIRLPKMNEKESAAPRKASQPQLSKTVLSPKQPEEQPSQSVPISEIRGLHDQVIEPGEDIATLLTGHVPFDPSIDRRSHAPLILFLGLLVAVTVAFAALPNLRREAKVRLTKLKEQAGDLMGHKSTSARNKLTAKPIGQKQQGRQQSKSSPAPGDKCRASLSEKAAKSDNPGAALAERVAVAECNLLYDRAAKAEEVLNPLKKTLQGLSDSELNESRGDRGLSEAFNLLLLTMVKQGKAREAERLLRKRCETWTQSNACLAKLLVLTESSKQVAAESAEVDKMLSATTELGAKARIWLWLAAAKMAYVQDKAAQGDGRIQLALASAPAKAWLQRKYIYETQALHLYQRGDLARVKAIGRRGLDDLKPAGAGASAKLSLLLDLADKDLAQPKLRTLLSKEDTATVVLSDPMLLDVLGYQCLSRDLEEPFTALLKRARIRESKNARIPLTVARPLVLWEVRGALALGQYNAALKILTAYGQSYGEDLASHHLRGVAYLQASGQDYYKRLAVVEFQEAVRLGRNWESLYALGVAALRGREMDQVTTALAELDKVVATDNQRYWRDMLKAEWYLSTAKSANARTLLEKWLQHDEELLTARRLLVVALTNMREQKVAAQIDEALKQKESRRVYRSEREDFSSPIGYMALFSRT